MMLYPAMSSHRELSPKHRQRMGIGEGLVRLSVGIEAVEDVIADLEQALLASAPASFDTSPNR
jgi:cystathionine beta-lyase/cystathionine gamma-synthase